MTTMVIGGCLRHANTPPPSIAGVDAAHYQNLAKKIEIPDQPTPSEGLLATTPAPRSLVNLDSEEYLDLSLEETIHLAVLILPSSKRIRASEWNPHSAHLTPHSRRICRTRTMIAL
jgi:hypothetical protein